MAIVATATMLVPWRYLLERRAARAAGGVAAVGLFAVIAAGGHAVSGQAIGIAYTATVVHLAAMATWVGGLCLLAVVVPRTEVMATAIRFSPIALGSVVALSVTGAVNGWRQVGTLDGVTGSSYGRWLVVKLVVVASVVAVAVVSRWLLHATPTDTEQRSLAVGTLSAARVDTTTEPALRRTVLIEAVGIAVVLAATAGLTGATPPRETASAAGIDVTVTVTEQDHIAQIDLLPAVTGGTTMHVTITSPRGSLEQADEITVTTTLPAQQIGPIDIVTFSAGPNHVTTNEADFPIPGDWTITVTARYGEFDQLVFATDVAITVP